MLILAKATLAMMIGFILSVFFGLVLIPELKKLKIRQKVNFSLERLHAKKDGTPTMGGLIFIIPTFLAIVILLLMNKIEISHNLLIVLFVFVSYAIIGFIDDFIIVKTGKNDGLTVIQKLLAQVVVAIIFFYIYMKNGNEPVIDIYTLGIEINLGWFYGLFILFTLVASSNAVNITDGLDGLAGGLSVMAFLAFGLISWGSIGISGHEEMAIFCFTLVGSLFGFLLFNTHPAKVFMGDTGSLALGAALATVAIITRHEITLIVVAGVFVVETLSCILQLISVKYFKHKILLMAPLHHHFEKLGWEETDIVKMFWVIGMMLSMAAITFGVWI